MFDEGSPDVEYFGPGGTSFRVLRQPEAATMVPNIIANVPPTTIRLSRSIDLISSFPGARRLQASRRMILKSAPGPIWVPRPSVARASTTPSRSRPTEGDRIPIPTR
jgi:hypothetical protein